MFPQLRDLWVSEISRDPTATITGTRIDIVPWMSRVTLDIIGLTGMIALRNKSTSLIYIKTGFNYNFNALDTSGQPNELSEALSTMFSASQRITILDILQRLIPVLHLIVSAFPILMELTSLWVAA